jgi:allantoicase
MSEAFLDLVDLASQRLGASVVAASDEFFAEKDRLIDPASPVWIEDRYTDRGKWMDGWETRRRRDLAGDPFDWCIVRLGARGAIRGIDVDTSHFTGNYPEACAIEVCDVASPAQPDDLAAAAWHAILSRSPLTGDKQHLLAIANSPPATHVRLRIFPDGGVARLRVYGEVAADWDRLRRRGEVDLASAEHGAVVVACSDMFFGSRHNLIMPGDARAMADGWETRRRRDGRHDWTIVRLAAPGSIERAEIDTRYFKGNAPGSCSLETCVDAGRVPGDTVAWQTLLGRTALQPDARHIVDAELSPTGPVTHVRLNIFPDGGVARLRLFGRPS